MTDLANRGPLGQKAAKPVRDASYIAIVKSLPCAVCSRPGPSDAHHCIHDRYDQRKACDYDTIPLCKRHHQHGPEAIHNGKESWREKHGPDHGYIDQTKAAVEDQLLKGWF